MTTYQTEARDDADLVDLAPGIATPAELTLYVSDWEDGYDVQVDVVAVPATETRLGRLECAQVIVKRRPGGPPVTGEVIRRLPIATLIRNTGVRWWQTKTQVHEGEVSYADERLTTEKAELLRYKGPAFDETLQWVARSYSLAAVLGDNPLRAVERTFGISRSAAGRWVARARERGFLAPEVA